MINLKLLCRLGTCSLDPITPTPEKIETSVDLLKKMKKLKFRMWIEPSRYLFAPITPPHQKKSHNPSFLFLFFSFLFVLQILALTFLIASSCPCRKLVVNVRPMLGHSGQAFRPGWCWTPNVTQLLRWVTTQRAVNRFNLILRGARQEKFAYK